MRISSLAFSLVTLVWAQEALFGGAFSPQRALLVSSHGVVHKPLSLKASAPAVTASSDGGESSVQASTEPKKTKNQIRHERARKEGGLFSFHTKYGNLNPFAIYYGLVAISLGIPWYMLLTLYQLFALVTFGKLDKQRKIPIIITHVWGTALMRLTRCFPKMVNRDKLMEFYKEKRPAMFVANHNSWLDIPFLGATIGWRNYKIIAKKELHKVPLLGKAIKVGGNVSVDRTNRRSQLETLKKGIQYLKDGVILCTFPEGTRSKNGRLHGFKNGAFKMAHKAGAPVIPLSIVGAQKVNPPWWMFPMRAAYPAGCQVIAHDPIESKDKTEAELAEAVREAMISGLPEDQVPASK